MSYRSGFVALVGRPNVGKSTLLNALLGSKLSIVTPRPQTTRDRVLGILNLPGGQIAFVDTPGLHSGEQRALNRAMNRTATAALSDADLVVFMVEALRFTEEDQHALDRLRSAHRPAIAAINKIDKLHDRATLLPFIATLATHPEFKEIVPISALRTANLEALQQVILSHLPEALAMFPPDQLTDRSERFRIAEIIREKLTLELNQEVPYGIAIELETFNTTDDGRTEVGAVIWVDRAGQKPIVIGAGGERLKRVGRAARLELNQLFSRRFHVTLWVKVRENWADDARALQQLGLE
jgi:GTPase